MRIYIATKFQNKKGFNRMKRMLEASGHTITHDWTVEDASKVPPEHRKPYLVDCAAKDIYGVASAEALVLLAYPKMAGAFVEFGLALATGIPIVVVDAFKEGNPDNIFYHIPRIKHVDNFEAVVKMFQPRAPLPSEPPGVVPSNN